jgi:protein TonB
MKIGGFLGVACAVVLHGGFILFGGILFSRDEDKLGTTREVQLVTETPETQEEDKAKEPEATEKSDEQLESEVEEAPNADEIVRSLEVAPMNDAPALDAASLSAIEQALNGQASGGGDFGDILTFNSGGRIGGMGKADALDEKIESAFTLAEIDQKPRPTYQASPMYPNELRAKKLEGVVTLIFVVDANGKVASPRVEKSTHAAFDKPALDALKQWRFEPALKGGQRVSCKMRVPIRFQPS